MIEEIIRLDNVCKNFQMGDNIVTAVCGINLHIKRGDFIALVGPSGSGKSTMMNLVGALDMATEGEIYLDGKDIEHLEESELAQIRGKKIGFIFQTFNLIPTLTAKENVMIPMMFQNYSREEKESRAEELLKELGLEKRLNHLPAKLSGGERQRVAIARALANNPEVILADEPTGNLDSKTGEQVMEILKNLNKQGKTVIMVTHNLEMAKQAKRIIKLKDGKIEK
jgi:putative ABC transport system ATP-binding protein